MKKILFVDEDQRALNAMEQIARHRYRVLTSRNGLTALYILKKHPDIRAVISDMRIRGMNGIEFLERSQGIVPNAIRVLFAYSIDEAVLADAVNRASITRYLRKPSESDLLLDVLAQYSAPAGCANDADEPKAADAA